MGLTKRILVIEDEPTCQIMLTQALAFKFHLDMAANIARAKTLLAQQRPDLILLDFYLPDGDAFHVIQFVKDLEDGHLIPIILLTQESAVQIKVRSFSEGVYDFITKPFNSAELLARIESHLSRASELRTTGAKLQRIGDLELDTDAQKISLIVGTDVSALQLSPIEYKILVCLMQNAGKVRTREQIAIAAWKRKYFQIRTIDRHISSVRKKLGPCANYLQTVSQGGYLFMNTHPAENL